MEPRAEAAELFYSGAITRIVRTIPVLAVAALPLIVWRWRWPVAAGFAVGAVLSMCSFWSLSRSVEALAERITVAGSRESGGRIIALLLLRHLVIAVVAYGILRGSVAALYGLLGGLALPVAAICCEAAFELYVAMRRGL